jgi:hypothetical protein
VIIATEVFLSEHVTNKARMKYSDKGEKEGKENSINERTNME